MAITPWPVPGSFAGGAAACPCLESNAGVDLSDQYDPCGRVLDRFLASDPNVVRLRRGELSELLRLMDDPDDRSAANFAASMLSRVLSHQGRVPWHFDSIVPKAWLSQRRRGLRTKIAKLRRRDWSRGLASVLDGG